MLNLPPQMRDAASGLSLVQTFTRIIALFHGPPQRSVDIVATLDSVTVPQRAAVRRLWIPPDAASCDQLTRFFLPSVGTYLAGIAQGQGGHCVIRQSDPALLNYRRIMIQSRTTRWEAKLNGCEIYVFNTGVLALVFDLCLERVGAGESKRSPATLDDLVEFNHLLRVSDPHFAPDLCIRGQPSAASNASPDPILQRLRSDGLTLPSLARTLFEPLHQRGIEVNPADERAYRIQTYAQLPGDVALDQLAEPLFRLRRVVRESYQAAPGDLDLNNHPEIVRTWGNVVLGVSLEGMAMIVVNTGHPFFTEVQARARGAYFAHYLIALHQRAALRHLAVEAARLPVVDDEIRQRSSLASVRELRARATNFNLHHRFSQVSSATPYAALYERLVKVLGIPDLLREIRDEISELDELIRRDSAEHEAARSRLLNYLVAIFGVLAITVPLISARIERTAIPAKPWQDRGVVLLVGATVAAIIITILSPLIVGLTRLLLGRWGKIVR
jgi:hypothetical protein